MPLFFLVVLSSVVFSQSNKQFMHLDKEDGLANNSVNAIFQDSYGYLWVGTWNGLSKFDGYTFENYVSDETSNSLPGNWIITLFEDSDSTLWVGTNGGVAYYDRTKNAFAQIEGAEYNGITSFYESPSKQLWCTVINGILIFDIASKSFVKKLDASVNPAFQNIQHAVYDKKGNVWVGTQQGVVVVDVDEYAVVKQYLAHGKEPFINNNIKHLAFDYEGKLWIGTLEDGITVLDTAANTSVVYKHAFNNDNSLSSDFISHIYIDKKNTIWICCLNGQLNKYDETNNTFIRYSGQNYKDRYIQSNSLGFIGQDREGNYWIGAHGNGIYCLSEEYNMFELFQGVSGLSDEFTTGGIRSFAELDDGTVVIGSDGKGLHFLNPESRNIEPYRYNDQLKSQHILKLLKDKDKLWCATWGGGVSEITLNEELFVVNHVNEKGNKNSLNFNNIKALHATDSNLWIGTHGDGVAIYDYTSNSFFHHNNPTDFPIPMKEPLWTTDITETSDGRIWVSSVYGVRLFLEDTVHFFLHEKSDDKSLANNYVYSVFEDSKKNVWFITAQGVDRFNDTTFTFEHFSKTHCFPQYPREMVEDDNGMLWITAYDGVYKISSKDYSVQKFDKYDGIVDGEFHKKAAFKASDGKLYFGSTKGFMRCDPNKTITASSKHFTVFRNLYINYQLQEVDSVSLQTALDVADGIILEYSKDIFSIEVAAIHLSKLNQATYSYKLEGYQDKWIDMGENRMITFPALSPGEYVLHVKSKLKSGGVSEKQLQITILPPWWMTVWFKVLMAAVIVSIIVLIVYVRVKMIKRQNILLLQKVNDRTKDLKEANTALELQTEKLQERNMLIAIKNEELEEANNNKNKLFSIISHDIKNPLNAIMGVAQFSADNFNSTPPDKTLEQIRSIARAAKSLTNLTLNLLDWSMIQTNTFKPAIVECNLERIVQEAVTLYEENARKKEIKVSVYFNHNYWVLADEKMLNTVIRNIFNNSIKFTPEGGSVSFYTEDSQNYVKITIADSGVGMTEETIDIILNSHTNTSTYGTSNEKGTGLGLMICKEFIEKMNAKLAISSSVDNGTQISILIPKSEKAQLIETVSYDVGEEPIAVEDADVVTDANTTICVVEDNAEIQSYIKNIFQKNYNVAVAANGEEGLALITETVPDVIIADVFMPEMDGLEMIKVLRKNVATNHIPVIILSARDMNKHLIEGYQAGADDYVVKPFNKDVLFNKVKAALEQRARLKTYFNKVKLSADSTDIPESNDEKFLRDIAAVMQEEYNNEEFSVEFLAQKMSIGRVQLYRKFMAIVGKSPKEYITQYRLEKAAILLKTNKFRVSDVAFEVGFSNPRYFSKCFGQHFGMPPKAYIQKHNDEL